MIDSVEEVDFVSDYLAYTSETECPTFFHRWTAISCLSAYLGRSVYFNHGHFRLHANCYVMLMGSPGTKKSSAIKIGAKLLKTAGYTTFGAKKTRQEKFLADLADMASVAYNEEVGDDYAILDQNIFGKGAEDHEGRPAAECFVAADEFNNFIGIGNTDFISILGDLWDYEGVFDYKLRNSDSIFIPDPTINILGGNTPTGFAQAFPVETIGQGFFSRLLLIHAEPSGVKYTFPPAPDLELQDKLVETLHEIKAKVRGELRMTSGAMQLLDKIYQEWQPIHDMRFSHYSNRRLTHLLKLCLTVAASKLKTQIDEQVVIEANTLLVVTEHKMPKALGEFGNSRNSGVSHKVLSFIEGAEGAVVFKDIWKAVHQDLDNRNQLVDMLVNLQAAEKIQSVDSAYLPVRKSLASMDSSTVDFSLLSNAELGVF